LNIAPNLIRKYTEENFSVEVMTKKYLDLYEDIYLSGQPKLSDLDEEGPIALAEAPGAAA
jgi:hypothetical protein